MPSDDAQNPSLSEAFEKAQGTFTKDEPEPEAVEEEVVEEVEAQDDPEPTEDDGEASLDSVDPDQLPEELKPLYKNLMKGFTQGRQRDAEARRDAEKRAQELEERLAALEKQATPEEPPKFNTPQEYYAYLAREEAKKTVDAEREKLQQEQVENFRTQALADYEAADPRLAQDGDSYDGLLDSYVGTRLDKAMAQYVEKNGTELGFQYKPELTKLIKEYDTMMKERQEAYLKKASQLAKARAAKAKKHAPNAKGVKSQPSGKIGLRDAISAAMEKVGS